MSRRTTSVTWQRKQLANGLCSQCGKRPRVTVRYLEGDVLFLEKQLTRCRKCLVAHSDKGKASRQPAETPTL